MVLPSDGVATAERVTLVPCTVAPFAGAVIETVGASVDAVVNV
jgi:hypothetical protein